MSEREENLAYEEGYRDGIAAERAACAKVADAAFSAHMESSRRLAIDGLPHGDKVSAAGACAGVASTIRARSDDPSTRRA